jgi:hypothetical protein
MRDMEQLELELQGKEQQVLDTEQLQLQGREQKVLDTLVEDRMQLTWQCRSLLGQQEEQMGELHQ